MASMLLYYFFFILNEALPQKRCLPIIMCKHLPFHYYHWPFFNLEVMKITVKRQVVTKSSISSYEIIYGLYPCHSSCVWVIEESYWLLKFNDSPFFFSTTLTIPRGLDRFRHIVGHKESRFMALNPIVYILLSKVSYHLLCSRYSKL